VIVIPERIPTLPQLALNGKCDLQRWMISPELTARLIIMAERAPFPLSIFSGHRSAKKQLSLAAEGRPAAPVDVSTHTSCPATGADVTPNVAITRVVQAQFGEAAVLAGLRWGGGSPCDPETGIPSDWRHVDLGPRGRAFELGCQPVV